MTLRIVAGKFKGRYLEAPKTITTRPTQAMLREAVFNICQMEVENSRVLDLYAGSGAIGFEALSRGASHVTFVEKNKQALNCIKKNIETLNVTAQVTILPLDAAGAIKKLKGAFDIIYVDPPYDLPLSPILEGIVENNLLMSEGNLFVEERYDPKKQSKPFTSDKLLLRSSRKFGTALLHHYLCTYSRKTTI